MSDHPFLLAEGAVVELVRRNHPEYIDEHVAHAGMIYDETARRLLEGIYTGYIETALRCDLPIVIFAPTWRCQPERMALSPYKDQLHINSDAVAFMRGIADVYKHESPNIYVGAIVGCKGDPYHPEEALTEEASYDYHQKQISELATTDIDVLQAATLPSLTEARGIVQCMAEKNVAYIISFMISPEGTLLDGTPISEAIESLDAVTQKPPLFYMCNCIHPDHFLAAIRHPVNDPVVMRQRMKGLQANTSNKRPYELNNATHLDAAESPKAFARKMAALKISDDLAILGGCCGTDHRHIQFLAENLT